MTDQNENPLNGESPTTYDEAYFNDDAAHALYDTFLMLRDYGYTVEELYPLALAIEKTTIYGGLDPETLRWWCKEEENIDE